MDSVLLRFLCSNRGAVNTDDLVFNVCVGQRDMLSQLVSNRSRFVQVCRFGQPRVVARTDLRLCRAAGCPGGCGGLHLCRNFLFSGICRWVRARASKVLCQQQNWR